jgi:predicted dehydrogenase
VIKVACIGAGYFSRFHFDGWSRLDDASLIGVTDRDRAKAEATGLPVFDDLPQMLERAKPDILDIIVSPEGHADAIRQAIAHGVETVICQKPFCTSPQEAQAMTQAADDAGMRLIIHENFRFQPWYRVIRQAMNDGAIGRPLQATFRLRPGDGQGADAYLDRQPYFREMERFLIRETGVHFVDTFRFLFGNPSSVYADLRRVNEVISGEDAGVVVMEHATGVRSILDANRNLDHAAENTRCTMGEGLFEGSDGTLTLHGDGSVHLRAFGAQSAETILGADTSPNFGGDCTYHLQRHVIEALKGLRPFENKASEYLFVIKLEASIYSSALTGTKIEV